MGLISFNRTIKSVFLSSKPFLKNHIYADYSSKTNQRLRSSILKIWKKTPMDILNRLIPLGRGKKIFFKNITRGSFDFFVEDLIALLYHF